jgi:hypothetical protein
MIPNVGSLVSGIGSLAGKVGSLFSGSSNTQTTDTLPSNIQTGDVRTFGATPQKFTNPFPDNLSINQQGFNSESNSNVV